MMSAVTGAPDEPNPEPATTTTTDALALVAEAMRRSGLVWVTVGEQPPRAVWHVWHEGADYVLHGDGEQDLPGLDTAVHATVTVRSTDTRGRLVVWHARVEDVGPETQLWHALVPLLVKQRLNAADGEQAPARWAARSRLARLVPTGELAEEPGRFPDDSLATPPRPSRAATKVPLPWQLGRRRRR
jgi:hypothetical protein